MVCCNDLLWGFLVGYRAIRVRLVVAACLVRTKRMDCDVWDRGW